MTCVKTCVKTHTYIILIICDIYIYVHTCVNTHIYNTYDDPKKDTRT